MNLPRFSRNKKIGMPPGSLVYVGEKYQDHVRITEVQYNEEEYELRDLADPSQVSRDPSATDRVTWLNIDGLHDVDIIKRLTDRLGLHHLMMEDVLNTEQRPKSEDFEEHLLITAKMIQWNDEEEVIEYEQVSFVLGDGILISFQERVGDVFDPVRERLKNKVRRIRQRGADYLAFALLDVIIDNYFRVLDRIEHELEDLEDELYESVNRNLIIELQQLKKQIVFLRRSVYPLREVFSRILKNEFSQIDPENRTFYMDAYDHVVQINESIDAYREVTTGLKDLYMSTVSFEMNQVMQVLTIIATIFIPLTFLAGIYGMNFEYMPELGWKYSYLTFWIVILVIGAALFAYFRRNDWI